MRELVIQNPTGIHARPAGMIAKEASKFACKVEIESNKGLKANAKSIVSLLKLGLKQGDSVKLCAEGEQAEEALTSLPSVIESVFE